MRLRNRSIDPTGTPLVMGVLNVTPDSFSDGGAYRSPGDAVARALEMVEEGAGIIDIGPESTRPGAADEVSAEEQLARAMPVIEGIRNANQQIALSIDTRLAQVAEACLQAGADMVNDVSALRDDPHMAEVVATAGVPVVLMHRRGRPGDMQAGGGPHYDDLIGEISALLTDRAALAKSRGIEESQIILDPGIGFGKRLDDNLRILRHVDRFVGLGYPILIGASRKSFIGKILNIEAPKDRFAGSLACAAIATMAGAFIIRAHDVGPTVEVVRLCVAVRQADASPA